MKYALSSLIGDVLLRGAIETDLPRIGRGDVDGNGDAQRIHEDVALAALDVFMSIKTADSC